jgi:hypothetical protein
VVGAVAVSAAPAGAQTGDVYVGPGGTVQVAPSNVCAPPGVSVVLGVTPSNAGTASFGPSSCGILFTASTTYSGPATVTSTTAGTTTPLPIPITVLPAEQVVVQGNTVDVFPSTICYPPEAQVAVTPTDAGTARFGGSRCGVRFTASTTYLGPFQLVVGTAQASGQTQTLYVVPRPAGFTQPTVRASGSFTPVTPPPPPGPCILLTANTVVQFGDITVGGPFQNGDVAPTVSGCADPNIDQSVLVQTSSATNGSASLAPGCPGVEPATCTPATGEFAVALVNSTLVDDFVLRPTPTTWIASERGTFTARSADLAVKLPATVDAGAVGTSFSFDVTFTAVTI